MEEENEGDVVEEEDGDVGEEGMEDVPDELEEEEDDEHGGELQEHAEMGDPEDEEHHDVFKDRRKRKEFEVCVGGLDKDATEDDVRKVFSQVGEVTEVRVTMIDESSDKEEQGACIFAFFNC